MRVGDSGGTRESERVGTVYLVGAGPGDPGLLTRRGADRLAIADVVVYDHLASSRLLDLARTGTMLLCAGKSVGHCTMSQPEIHQTLIEHARAGRTVVRLKGGDPLIFGRGAEEAEALRSAGIPFEIVPGVTAAVGASATSGIPLTHREAASAVAFVTGHANPEDPASTHRLDWPALARFPGTLVVYMGVSHLGAICRTLIREGMPPETPAAVVESGTTPAQRTMVSTLAELPRVASESSMRPPALLIVGEVARMRAALNWFEDRPLFGQRIVVTRPSGESERSASVLESLGAEVILAPTVQIGPMEECGPLDDAIDQLSAFDWLVFTSSSGVRFFVKRLDERGRDLRALGHLRLAAIGPTTAETLAAYHLRADLVPDEFRSEALAEALAEQAAGARILLARADRGRAVLRDELQHVAEVVQVATYRNADIDALPLGVAERIAEGTVDWITLTSSAIVRRLHGLLPGPARERIGREVRLASLSPVTTATVRELGWEVAVEARRYDWPGLVDAIVEKVGAERGSVG